MQYKYCCWLLTLPLVSFSASDSLYGKRYCEIVSSANYADFNVYNTNGLNDCPKSWWGRLKDTVLQKKYNYKFVHLNGPRLWLIDSISSQDGSSNEVKNFEGQKLKKVASFHPDLTTIMKSHGPYTDYLIQRKHSYQINKGRTVYEIVTAQGKIYVLHSISLKRANQSPEKLNNLMHSLKLPKGWYVKQGVIHEDKSLKPTAQSIHVLQDEYENTYQLTSSDFLK